MKITKFEDLSVWQEAMRLTVDIYSVLKQCNDFGLKTQMQRSAVSVPSNIAEGFDRHTNKEFIYFLYIAKGSCAELRTQLYLAERLQYITTDVVNELLELTRKVSAMLFKLIKVRKENFK